MLERSLLELCRAYEIFVNKCKYKEKENKIGQVEIVLVRSNPSNLYM